MKALKFGIAFGLLFSLFIGVGYYSQARAAAVDASTFSLRKALVSPSNETLYDALKYTSETGNSNAQSVTSSVLQYDIITASGLMVGGYSSDGTQVLSGVVPNLGSAITAMINNPPTNTGLWLADVMQNSPFVPQAYAQGLGFKSLSPVLQIWKAFRDVSYVFFVVAFLFIGFMIMFRQKLGGQTVVTITSAIPNLIITLLLITFSYAISGFLIDIMYLIIYLIVGIFKTSQLLPETLTVPGLPGTIKTISLEDIALSNNIFFNGLQLVFGEGWGGSAGNAAGSVGKIVEGFFASAGNELSTQAGKLVGGSVSILAYLIFAIAIFFAVTQTFFKLLISYVKFIINVIFSPFLLMLDAFSGKSDIGQWLRNMFSNLLPFPIVITMIFLAMTLSGMNKENPGVGYQNSTSDQQQGGFQAPQLALWGDSGKIGGVQGLIAIGILMLIPEAVKMSEEFLHAKSPFDKYLGTISQNLQKGWKGGKLVDGLDFTDTSKWNVAGMGALSAENIARKGAIGAYGAGGFAVGAGNAALQGKSSSIVLHEGAEMGSTAVSGMGKRLNDPQVEAWTKKREEDSKKSAEEKAKHLAPTRPA